jgi:hypothetical protein
MTNVKSSLKLYNQRALLIRHKVFLISSQSIDVFGQFSETQKVPTSYCLLMITEHKSTEQRFVDSYPTAHHLYFGDSLITTPHEIPFCGPALFRNRHYIDLYVFYKIMHMNHTLQA